MVFQEHSSPITIHHHHYNSATAILLTLVITCIMNVKISSRIFLHTDMVELYHFLVKHLVTLPWWYNCVHKFIACVCEIVKNGCWVDVMLWVSL